uniref:Uncharacterized protein n=1 Tax=Oryza sativa subsp. japonica TaxID=39947 RepID=Q2QZ85_ORYSJ|nr:hypothetical protein LOC_Os11g47339 [Oryza sativa Japonica Group]
MAAGGGDAALWGGVAVAARAMNTCMLKVGNGKCMLKVGNGRRVIWQY